MLNVLDQFALISVKNCGPKWESKKQVAVKNALL